MKMVKYILPALTVTLCFNISAENVPQKAQLRQKIQNKAKAAVATSLQQKGTAQQTAPTASQQKKKKKRKIRLTKTIFDETMAALEKQTADTKTALGTDDVKAKIKAIVTKQRAIQEKKKNKQTVTDTEKLTKEERKMLRAYSNIIRRAQNVTKALANKTPIVLDPTSASAGEAEHAEDTAAADVATGEETADEPMVGGDPGTWSPK